MTEIPEKIIVFVNNNGIFYAKSLETHVKQSICFGNKKRRVKSYSEWKMIRIKWNRWKIAIHFRAAFNCCFH